MTLFNFIRSPGRASRAAARGGKGSLIEGPVTFSRVERTSHNTSVSRRIMTLINLIQPYRGRFAGGGSGGTVCLGETDSWQQSVVQAEVEIQACFSSIRDHFFRIKRRFSEIKSFFSAEKRINSREKQINSREKQINAREKQINAREKQINAREKQISSREKQISSREKQINSREKQISSREKQISSREKQISSREKQINSREKRINAAEKQIRFVESDSGLESSRSTRGSWNHEYGLAGNSTESRARAPPWRHLPDADGL
jgi:hypothetical protein